MTEQYHLFPGVTDKHSQHDDQHWLIQANASTGQLAFLQQARSWAQALPNKQYMILLTKQRRHFLTGFVAAQLRQQTVLLPSNNSPGAIAETLAHYPNSYCLVDESSNDSASNNASLHIDCTHFTATISQAPIEEFIIDPSHVAAIAFTSGSTGIAKPYPKTWASLVVGARLAKQRFGFDTQHSIVATVPSQHMYGLETTVMVPLMVGSQLYADKPFFPEDIRIALNTCSGKRVLITTPIHLRACVAAGLQWPVLDFVISATAPLDRDLLKAVRETFNTRILEIYGCTEAGSLASRDPSESDNWTLYDDFMLSNNDVNSIVSAAHLSEDVVLSDVVKIVDHNRFLLLGRHADMVNIAGKRASLSDLNIKLVAVDGVQDGVFFMSDKNGKMSSRLTALVVAPNVELEHILKKLSEQIDSVFLPRPLYKVSALPRNETGKISRDALLQLLSSTENVA